MTDASAPYLPRIAPSAREPTIETLRIPGAGGGVFRAGGGGGGYRNLQMLARQNLRHFLELSEQTMDGSQQLLSRNSGRWQCLMYTCTNP